MDEQVQQLGEPPDRTRFRVAFARAGRKLGDRPLADEQAELRSWTMRDLGRAVLLLEALRTSSDDEQVSLVDHVFRTGELGEQQSVVRVLARLPKPERFAPLAAEATRTNAMGVFEALACDNPYPGRHMSDLAFNQMVMKAIFNEISVTRILGLRERTTPELVRIAQDYASERRAAGRPVPADVAVIEDWLEQRS